jgi:uncharacterized membrane protein YhaH (DUF805 family)
MQGSAAGAAFVHTTGGFTMNWKSLLFSFDGRVGRGPYWALLVVSLLLFGAMGAVGVMDVLYGNPDQAGGSGGTMGLVLMLVSLAFLWPALAIQAKRWHDVDKSGWWVLINLVPALGALVALVFNGFIAGSNGPNRFGSAPGN